MANLTGSSTVQFHTQSSGISIPNCNENEQSPVASNTDQKIHTIAAQNISPDTPKAEGKEQVVSGFQIMEKYKSLIDKEFLRDALVVLDLELGEEFNQFGAFQPEDRQRFLSLLDNAQERIFNPEDQEFLDKIDRSVSKLRRYQYNTLASSSRLGSQGTTDLNTLVFTVRNTPELESDASFRDVLVGGGPFAVVSDDSELELSCARSPYPQQQILDLWTELMVSEEGSPSSPWMTTKTMRRLEEILNKMDNSISIRPKEQKILDYFYKKTAQECFEAIQDLELELEFQSPSAPRVKNIVKALDRLPLHHPVTRETKKLLQSYRQSFEIDLEVEIQEGMRQDRQSWLSDSPSP